PGNGALRDRVNELLLGAMRDGTLERILRKWNIWNNDQPRLFARLLAGEAIEAGAGGPEARGAARRGRPGAARRDPASARGAAGVTLALSFVSMGGAVFLGVLIATGRVYGVRLVRLALTGYVELMRGTPVLLQLFVIYYGLATAIRLPAFLAATLGLALNYA